jgi:NNP family nitrate/nitrite transporter-like MFS transporter
MHAARNYRVWILFCSYAACFGIEIFIHNIIAMYYVEHFSFGLKEAGLAAGIFGLLALFARALGGILSDKVALKKGLDGRTKVLFGLILGEGLFLMLFSNEWTCTRYSRNDGICIIHTHGMWCNLCACSIY